MSSNHRFSGAILNFEGGEVKANPSKLPHILALFGPPNMGHVILSECWSILSRLVNTDERRKKTTGGFIGALIMVYYNPYILG